MVCGYQIYIFIWFVNIGHLNLHSSQKERPGIDIVIGLGDADLLRSVYTIRCIGSFPYVTAQNYLRCPTIPLECEELYNL